MSGERENGKDEGSADNPFETQVGQPRPVNAQRTSLTETTVGPPQPVGGASPLDTAVDQPAIQAAHRTAELVALTTERAPAEEPDAGDTQASGGTLESADLNYPTGVDFAAVNSGTSPSQPAALAGDPEALSESSADAFEVVSEKAALPFQALEAAVSKLTGNAKFTVNLVDLLAGLMASAEVQDYLDRTDAPEAGRHLADFTNQAMDALRGAMGPRSADRISFPTEKSSVGVAFAAGSPERFSPESGAEHKPQIVLMTLAGNDAAQQRALTSSLAQGAPFDSGILRLGDGNQPAQLALANYITTDEGSTVPGVTIQLLEKNPRAGQSGQRTFSVVWDRRIDAPREGESEQLSTDINGRALTLGLVELFRQSVARLDRARNGR
ncbi:hypothetical protein CO046_00795 [Candidatus Peregrinibacteria bacterium CG_4_9_14_0_2_um_filter_53_11]|uniref:Uncharacterized protein n=1 Tax=candidate division WWE3 bacterium CG_4_9_14_3_um_filter_39_7 TaxID=1975080 RepID=A0A2M7X2E3_UNCKA|nr:MAG: hypothetical protein CO179_02595 [candidate division WWE3 bacterium CG_4_9_14_3_um_filter_39_7]PJC37369.1 MAG: hypothetical protein CO046_00795 [Candidatus Peregrinibacteria bacterium CG_4_9_14_0_2_um_filter_53_11]